MSIVGIYFDLQMFTLHPNNVQMNIGMTRSANAPLSFSASLLRKGNKKHNGTWEAKPWCKIRLA